MSSITVIKENWLTRKPSESSYWLTLILSLFLFSTSSLFLLNGLNAAEWMPATAVDVFKHHEYWRPWTALFAHADGNHLISNTFLFVPLSYLLMSYYSTLLFPVLGIILGGLINFVVLTTLPESASIVGISGVVYWMAAVWLTLFVLVDSRKSFRRRFSLALFLSLMLLAPESYKPEISYLSHFLGYILGIATAIIFYLLNYSKFKSAEVTETFYEENDDLFSAEHVSELNAQSLNNFAYSHNEKHESIQQFKK